MLNVIGRSLEAIQFCFQIFPLKERDKAPVRIGGCGDATKSQARVSNHWRQYPNHNYGIATGAPSGIFVLDIDGPDGEASLRGLVSRYGLLPPTVTVITGAGRHLYLQSGSARVRNSVGKLGRGVDVRGDGGYVVGAGSVHPTGHVYEYAPGMDPGALTIAPPPRRGQGYRI